MNTILLILLVFIATLFGIARTFLFLVQVEGWSMYPTYHHKDRLLAIRFYPPRWLRRNQVVVWKLLPTIVLPGPGASEPEGFGPELYVKRLIGVAGDEIIRPVEPRPQPSDRVRIPIPEELRLGNWHVPAGYCFVKGDSPGFDSTVFGPIPLDCIRGIVLTRLGRTNRGLTTSLNN